MCLAKANKFFVAVISAAVLCLSPLLSHGFEGLGLEPNNVQKVSDSAMDDIRGRYYGFHFSINFTGYWDTIGSTPGAVLTYDAGFGPSMASGTINLVKTDDDVPISSGDDDVSISSGNVAVNTLAMVGGGLNGANGAIQLTQVPGNMNFVYSGMVINLAIFNINDVKDATSSGIRQAISSLGPFF